MQHWHITFAAEDRPTLFPGSARRLAAARALARVAGRDTLLFCVVDDHGHLVAQGSRQNVGRVASSVLQALSPLAEGSGLAAARIRPVRGRAHLDNLVRYVLDQSTHHELQLGPPALWEGSCFQDLVGARLLPGFRPELLREALPRLAAARPWEAVGLGVVAPATDALLEAVGPASLGRSALAAVGAESFAGRSAPTVLARRAYAQVGRRAGFDAAHLARPRRCTGRSACRWGCGRLAWRTASAGSRGRGRAGAWTWSCWPAPGLRPEPPQQPQHGLPAAAPQHQRLLGRPVIQGPEVRQVLVPGPCYGLAGSRRTAGLRRSARPSWTWTFTWTWTWSCWPASCRSERSGLGTRPRPRSWLRRSARQPWGVVPGPQASCRVVADRQVVVDVHVGVDVKLLA